MGIDRRKFLKGMGSLALFSIVPSKVLGGPNHIAPSDQLTKGIIGVGGIGRSSYHFTSNEQCRLVSVKGSYMFLCVMLTRTTYKKQ